ncbi:MAG: hypothetical protein ACO39F_06895 [Candidatus Nanopelagicaceae bacterium]
MVEVKETDMSANIILYASDFDNIHVYHYMCERLGLMNGEKYPSQIEIRANGVDSYFHEEENDDSMDGDHDSAMASAGWGTDEDYGYYGE